MAFEPQPAENELPKGLNNPMQAEPSHLCKLAAKTLQAHLEKARDLEHNFGLKNEEKDKAIGKMFGVLVAKNKDNQIGFLWAFSGKLANSNHHEFFVPPVYDSLDPKGFLNTGMAKLSEINAKIKSLESQNADDSAIDKLKIERKNHSVGLQEMLFDSYSFKNNKHETKSLRDIFALQGIANLPAGAGECAAPKLFQHCFLHHYRPLSIAEFWWGHSTRYQSKIHGEYYGACEDKCRPILSYMLSKEL
jgi:tRNA pseudouridine32 synthase / 23S rRNA pseudouridine746 synthase